MACSSLPDGFDVGVSPLVSLETFGSLAVCIVFSHGNSHAGRYLIVLNDTAFDGNVNDRRLDAFANGVTPLLK
jgi:hypothetical protein